MKEGEKEIT